MYKKLTSVFIVTLLLYAFVGGAAQAYAGDKSCAKYRFDCGTETSPVKSGFTRVTEKTGYTPARGYGWLTQPDESFDADHVFIPDHLEQYTVNKPEPGDMQRDGVNSKIKNDLTFRVDLPDGKYFFALTVGSELRSCKKMHIYLDGKAFAEDVTTMTSWGGYATYKTFRRPVQVTGGKAEITVKHKWKTVTPEEETISPEEQTNSVLGIEFIPYVPYEISFADGKWQSPNTDGHLQKGLKGLNNHKWPTAQKSFEKIEKPILRATALAALADLLEVPEKDAHVILEKAVRIADKIIQDAPNSQDACLAGELKRIAECYLRASDFLNMLGYMRAFEQTGFNFPRRMKMAVMWLEQINEEEPLCNRAYLNLGRVHYGYWKEGGSKEDDVQFRKYFDVLKERQPDNRLVQMYGGKEIPWGEEYTEGIEGMPAWAVKQREAMGRLMAVLHWWMNNRQLDNGEMGGGYGDDVEMLRQWHVYLGGADDPTVRLGWRKIAHGVWFSRVIDQTGYSIGASDVQHSAEPMSDSHPALIGLDYGNPVWVERCLLTMQLMRDYWTGINKRGHRHFKSCWFGAKELSNEKKFEVDLPCCGRATRPGLWLGWYQRNPAVVKLFSEWMDAWAEDIMRQEDGKPAGIVPASITFEEDRVGGNSDTWWWDKDLYWSYFKFPGYIDLLYDHLLAVYDWTGDEKYLKPIEAGLDMVLEITRNPPKESPQEGSRAWAVSAMYSRMARTAAKYRLFTGNTKYDEYLKKKGSPYIKFLLTGDKKPLIEGCESAAAGARNNFEFKTTEVLWTDRVSVSQEPMWGMYTGGVDIAYYYPSYVVTWKNSGPHFAALVARADKKSLKVLACNFEDKTKQVQMNVWRLQVGSYQLKAGPDADNDDKMDEVTTSRLFDVTDRGTPVDLSIPARSVQVVEISQRASLPQSASDLVDRPDPAVGDQDLLVGITPDQLDTMKDWIRPDRQVEVKLTDAIPVTIVVHNLGRRGVDHVRVKLVQHRQEELIDVAETEVSLKGLDGLEPSRKAIVFKWNPGKAGDYKLQVVLEPVPSQREITRVNNTFTRAVRVTQ